MTFSVARETVAAEADVGVIGLLYRSPPIPENRTVIWMRWAAGPLAIDSRWCDRSTAATPSGLILKARNINGSLRVSPWCTRAKGS